MAELRNLEPKPAAKTTTTQGVMVTDSTGALAVNVWGSMIPCRWSDPVVVQLGDPVTVELRAGAKGQAEAIVTGRLTTAPRPATGTVTVVPVGSPTITVTGTDGVAYTAAFVASYTPTVNDKVILAWNASQPTVTGKVGTTAAPDAPDPVAPPPPPPQTGTSTYTAVDSDTFWGPGGWGSWANGGGHVYQGDYGAGQVYGAWFYGGSPKELAGRTITRIRFTFGSRRFVGASGSAVTAHVYAHTSARKPAGDVSRTVGPADFTIQPNQGQKTIDLPLNFASVLLAGGGISIAGNPYAGFNGRTLEPASGRLILDWSR